LIDPDDENITPDVKKQRVQDEILKGGTKRNHTQTAGINWNLPINKIPIFDWITSNFGYNVSYNWVAAPKSIQAALGNTISNNVNWNINGNADLNKLYNKVKPFGDHEACFLEKNFSRAVYCELVKNVSPIDTIGIDRL